MYKVGICGHFGINQKLLNGQTIKTKVLTEELIKALGDKAVCTVDTYGWKKNPVSLFIKCVLLIKKCENIVILPAQNGVKVFVPLFLLLNKFFHRRLHYIVIGGWLPNYLKDKPKLRNWVSKFNFVYVETHVMLNALVKQGLKNAKHLPNFKRLKALDESELIYQYNEPYKLCTFSRVMKEKGIEDAINAVTSINNEKKRVVFTLDIYGQIDDNYKERFDELKSAFPDYIKYKGVVDFDKSVDVLKEYMALLFPTYYEGEGFAGTILDAYASGVPIIATDWKYNAEIIHNLKDGLIYDYRTPEKLRSILIDFQKKPEILLSMKKECLTRAKEYLPEAVIGEFIKHL